MAFTGNLPVSSPHLLVSTKTRPLSVNCVLTCPRLNQDKYYISRCLCTHLLTVLGQNVAIYNICWSPHLACSQSGHGLYTLFACVLIFLIGFARTWSIYIVCLFLPFSFYNIWFKAHFKRFTVYNIYTMLSACVQTTRTIFGQDLTVIWYLSVSSHTLVFVKTWPINVICPCPHSTPLHSLVRTWPIYSLYGLTLPGLGQGTG